MTSTASVDSLTIIDAAQVKGTPAVIKSPHFDRLTPLVSRRGLLEFWFHLIVMMKTRKNKTIKKIKKNHNQNW